MNEPEILTPEQIDEAFGQAIDEGIEGVMSHLSRGKWHKAGIRFRTLTSDTVHIEIVPGQSGRTATLQIEQPVNISFQQGYDLYVFETEVMGVETSVTPSCGGRIILEKPDRVERLQRRLYSRVPVPPGLHVNVLFWHRGHIDDSTQVPMDDQWLGRLVNLSAGGLQMSVDLRHQPSFRIGQVLGVQFTPLPEQRPVFVEAQVIHMREDAEAHALLLGLEFLGLESRGQGRETLHRLKSLVDDYTQLALRHESHLVS